MEAAVREWMKLDTKAPKRSKVYKVLALHKICYKGKETLDFEKALHASQSFSW